MKKIILFLVTLLVISVLFLPGLILAQEESPSPFSQGNIFVKKDEIVDHDFFAGGNNVTISGVVNGDVFAGGGNITVDGTVNGDILAAGGMLNILGEVSDDVRIAGGTVFVNGDIGKNLTVAGGTVTLSSESRIGGSLLAFCGNLDARAPIGKDAQVYAGQATFTNKIGGNLKGEFENLVLTDEVQILGDLEYVSPQEATITEGAVVVGETTYQLPETKEEKMRELPARRLGFGLSVMRVYILLSSLLISFFLGWGFLYLFPKRADSIVKILTKRLWFSLGVGFLAMLLFVPAAIFLMITIIGIPLVFLLVPLFLFLVYFSKIFVTLRLGNYLLKRFGWKRGMAWALLLGLVIYYLLKIIPLVGTTITFAFAMAGLGAFLLDQKALRQTSR